MNTKKLSKTDTAYIAGLIDAEGCLGIYAQIRNGATYAYYMVVLINMTDEIPIRFITEKVGGSYSLQDLEGKRKPVYRYFISNKEAEPLLYSILPHLIVKKEQAKLLLEFWEFQKDQSKESKSCLSESREVIISGKSVNKRYRILSPDYIEKCEEFRLQSAFLNKVGTNKIIF
jgi:hypothetical protein